MDTSKCKRDLFRFVLTYVIMLRTKVLKVRNMVCKLANHAAIQVIDIII
jgi:hypothetical protein